MSFQIGILKVLSTHPDGCASVDAIKRDLATLSSREWAERLRRLAMHAPDIDAFSSGLIVRTPDSWQITDTGRIFLQKLETSDELANYQEPVVAKRTPFPVLPQRSLDQYRPETGVTRRAKVRRARQLAVGLN